MIFKEISSRLVFDLEFFLTASQRISTKVLVIQGWLLSFCSSSFSFDFFSNLSFGSCSSVFRYSL